MAHKSKLAPEDPNRKAIVDQYVEMTRKYGSIDRPREIRKMTENEYQKYSAALSEHYHSGTNIRVISDPRIPVELQKDTILLETLCERATEKSTDK